MKIRELLESMDGVSQGTHMFTSEETRGSAKTFGSESMAGIKNKERILRAASFVTKQRNHPQNQARLVRRSPGSPNGYEEVVTLSTEDTKLWAQKLQNFFKNPQNNSKHKYLYYYLSDPTDPDKIQGLINLIASSNQGMAEGDVVPFPGSRQLTWQQLPPDVLHLANEWFWASDDDTGLDAVMDPSGYGSGTKNRLKYITAQLAQRGWTIDYNDENDAPGEYNLVLKNKKGQTILLSIEDAQDSKGWAQGTLKDNLTEKRKKRKKTRRSVRGPVFYGGYGLFGGDASGEGDGGGVEESQLEEKWSEKYKRSINCSNPRGFSQRAHCQGRKKSSAKKPVGEAAVGSITVDTLEVLIDEHALERARERGVDPAAVDYIIKKQMPKVLSNLSQIGSGEKVWVYDWSRETALGLRRISSSELKFVLKTVWPGKPAKTPSITKIIRT
jgi:hypothetical protein